MSALRGLLEHYRTIATNEVDKGRKFERLGKFFLLNDLRFKERFSDVWLWSEFPLNEDKPDTGIDLVAKERDAEGYCAIQCKFYGESTTIEKANIDSFFTASGKDLYSSRLIFSTTDNWTKHAEDALANQQIPVNRISVDDMEQSSIDWSQFNEENFYAPQRLKKSLRPHQMAAHANVIDSFKTYSRGKLIMACGTGKTFTSLRIAESIRRNVLFLAPSISLVNQTFNEWASESELQMKSVVVCSDKTVKADDDDIHTYDLLTPPTTDPSVLVKIAAKAFTHNDFNVVFSTYQSIDVVIEAQKLGFPKFDLVICDEAHRTTGVTQSDRDDSHFTKVHDGEALQADRRLYMTATPRIYSEPTRAKADTLGAEVYSMDDETKFGPQFHYLGFGEAVEQNLLSDYKVMVLGVEEEYANRLFREANELQIEDDQIKIIGCWNGLAKKLIGDQSEGNPMRRAVAFSRSIKDSKRFTDLFSKTVESFVSKSGQEGDLLRCEVDHVDGTMTSSDRKKKLSWLKQDTTDKGNVCRILSNAKCLSEGVDVPTLDAVLFLNPRNSVVDVVQSVGRAMRRAEGKKYGYIIIPISIPANVDPEEALNDNKKYKVVWDVCQALRAHDDRFEATINKINLNKQKPDQVAYRQIGEGSEKGKDDTPSVNGGENSQQEKQLTLDLPTAEVWQNAILGKIAKKCGDRDYWENWAKDVSVIAERHIEQIKEFLRNCDEKHKARFERFLKSLRKNINPSVGVDDAIEMLSQHLITKPVFDALFEDYEFTKKNPVSKSMQSMVDVLEEKISKEEWQSLELFYQSVKNRASKIDNADGRQKVILELYDTFFRTAFPRMAKRLGIVYTPVEVVDFILHSVDAMLRQEFDVGITNEGVHVLDPFTGTGTFITRLLQSGLINASDLPRKYARELHANEIVLLAYYIATINIEESYHDLLLGLRGEREYQPFEGIVLTDTFQLNESQGTTTDEFIENDKRAKLQVALDIRVIMGNPPYSAGQDSENQDNKNLKYPSLDGRIRTTYVDRSKPGYKASLYDSYIRAFRWASDRLKDKGIVCFVSNGSFIDSVAMDGFRKSVLDEFDSIYVLNLRGNTRTAGETAKKEGGQIFGSGSRATIAITLLLKGGASKKTGKIFYCDIGEYLTRDEKLRFLKSNESFINLTWKKISPNESADWINQRDPSFDKFIPLGEKKQTSNLTFFGTYSNGVVSNRDPWVYNFSAERLEANLTRMIDAYNEQVAFVKEKSLTMKRDQIEKILDNNEQNIKWTPDLRDDLFKGKKHVFEKGDITVATYRPFTKEWYYSNKHLNWSRYLFPSYFPKNTSENLVIGVTGNGTTKEFSCLMYNTIVDRQALANGQHFPLYVYDEKAVKGSANDLLSQLDEGFNVSRKSNLTDAILFEFKKAYGSVNKREIAKLDIFYYVYGVLHSPEYRSRFASDLGKMLPRIPFVRDFWGFSDAGKRLSDLHVNYETLKPFEGEHNERMDFADPKIYRVKKISFLKAGSRHDKSVILINNYLVLKGVPLEAYDYELNGKSAIEWVMERYQVSNDRGSGIEDDPNVWSEEHNEPSYIYDLLRRVITLSLETMKIVKGLPSLEEIAH